MNQENALPPNRPVHFYENTKWRLLSYGIWLGLILLIAVIGMIGKAGNISALFSGKAFSSMMQIWLITAMIVPPMVMLVVSGHIDLSVGAVAGYVGTATAFAMSNADMGGWVGILIAIRTGLFIGLIHGILVGGLKIHSAIVTLGTATLVRGWSLKLAEQPLFADNLDSLSWLMIPTVILMLIFVIAIVFVSEFTPLGKKKISDQSVEEARLPRILRATLPHVLVSLAASFAGLLLLARLQVASPGLGLGLEVDVLLPVLMAGIPLGGGLVNIIGAIIASLALQLNDTLSIIAGDPVAQSFSTQGFQILFFAVLGKLYFWAADKIYQKRANSK
ncbi:MAG: Ribose import permease protein RbsC [Chloroflexota bacterium]|jgi:ribose transport system permease protein